MIRRKLTIELVIEATDAGEADAICKAVDDVLDEGTFQDAIIDFATHEGGVDEDHGATAITSITVTSVERIQSAKAKHQLHELEVPVTKIGRPELIAGIGVGLMTNNVRVTKGTYRVTIERIGGVS